MFHIIGEMSFKCLIFLAVSPRDVFRNSVKSLWWSGFAKIVMTFSHTLFLQKSFITDIRQGSKQALGNMSEEYLELS